MSKATTAERALNRKGGTMSRLIKTLFGFYPVLLPLVVVGVVLCAIINSIGATFLQSALQIISESWQSGDWEAAQPKILKLVTTLACIYGVGILSSLFWNRVMAIVTQGSLEKLRDLPGDYEVYPGHEGSTSLEYERRFNPYMLRPWDL